MNHADALAIQYLSKLVAQGLLVPDPLGAIYRANLETLSVIRKREAEGETQD